MQTAQANLGQHFFFFFYAQFSQNATHMIVCVAYVHIYVAVFLSCNKTCWEKNIHVCMYMYVALLCLCTCTHVNNYFVHV